MFHEVQKSYPVDDNHLNKLFTICDSNNDSKLTRKEFAKAIDLFLEPIYIQVKKWFSISFLISNS